MTTWEGTPTRNDMPLRGVRVPRQGASLLFGGVVVVIIASAFVAGVIVGLTAAGAHWIVHFLRSL